MKTADRDLVSVVVAFYNAERFLAESIESVLGQTYAVWELLLVDDGSTDLGPEIARRYAARHPGRISYLTHPDGQNHGMCTSRNLGVRASKGEYIAILDSDDVWLPHKLEEQTMLLGGLPEVGFLFGHSEYWYDWAGDGCAEKNFIPSLGLSEGVYQPPQLLSLCYPLGLHGAPCPSDFLLRRDLLQKIGGFEEEFDPEHQLYEDQALLTKIYLNASVFVAAACWDRYRIHDGSYSAVSDKLGRSEATRQFFFKWLGRYFRDNQVSDLEIWAMFWRRTRSYRYPRLARIKRNCRWVIGGLIRTIGRQ